MATPQLQPVHNLLQQMGELLKIRSAPTEMEWAHAIEERLPLHGVDQLLAVGLTLPEIDRLIIARRTLQHRRRRGEALTVQESDRLVRVGRSLAKAIDTFGSPERALTWLRTPRHRLGDRAPLDLLLSDAGARTVEEYLGQIDEGYFV